MDAGNLLKPMLARGELHCIGRHHPGRIPQVHREGPGPGAPLPARAGGRAHPGGHHLHPARPARALRGAPRGAHRRRRPGGGRRALPPLHPGPPAPGQGHRPDRRGRGHDPHRDRLPAHGELDTVNRRIMQLEIEQAALSRETDQASRERLERLQGEELAGLKEEQTVLLTQWDREKQSIEGLRTDEGRDREGPPGRRKGRARLRPEPRRRAALRHHPPPGGRAGPARGGHRRGLGRQPDAQGGGQPGRRGPGDRPLDRHPGDQAPGERAGKAVAPARSSSTSAWWARTRP